MALEEVLAIQKLLLLALSRQVVSNRNQIRKKRAKQTQVPSLVLLLPVEKLLVNPLKKFGFLALSHSEIISTESVLK